ACGLTNIHDMGFIAAAKIENGVTKRGFRFFVGGGLGSVPQNAKLFDEFLPEEEMLPMSQAVARVYARLGEKKDRARARIKFLIKDLGIEKFKELVLQERATLKTDPAWTAFLDSTRKDWEGPLKPSAPLKAGSRSEGYEVWAKSNVYSQKQDNYKTVIVALP